MTEEPCNFIVVRKTDFDRVLKQAELDRFETQLRFLHSCPSIRNFGHETIFKLAKVLNSKKFTVGEFIAHQGELIDPLEFVLIIKRGEVKVTQNVVGDARDTRGAGVQMKLCVLGPREIIVDSSTLRNVFESELRHRGSFVAATGVEVYVLSKPDFLENVSSDEIQSLSASVLAMPSPSVVAEIYETKHRWKKYRKDLVKK